MTKNGPKAIDFMIRLSFQHLELEFDFWDLGGVLAKTDSASSGVK